MSTIRSSQAALDAVKSAAASDKLSQSAADNIEAWLTEPRYTDYRDQVVEHVQREQWQQLDDVFWTIIPFGTGGRRGRMYPIGSNAINDRTIGESAQGLADYVAEYVAKNHGGRKELSCAIAYDTRHRSRHFTELCAGVMVAAGFKVCLLDDFRATPQLSFAVRELECDCGIMVTASHNPPSDNAVKVYWSNGAQVLPPHDKAIIDRVMSCNDVEVAAFDQAVAEGKVEVVTSEIDRRYLDAASACAFDGPRKASILYTPLHGVGAAAVLPLLQRDRFSDVEIFAPHQEPNGDFPNVPGHVSNPENAEVFRAPIERAREIGADLVLATDPDCDRIGCATPLTSDTSGPWRTFNGNEIGAILAEFVLNKRAVAATLSPDHYIVKTLVTSELSRRIAESYNVRCVGDLLVGFKYIAEVIDREGPDKFVFGTEESHGYLVGKYCRDKDGAVACMLMSELVAELRAAGRTLNEFLGDLHRKHGCHREQLVNLAMEGSEGMAAMEKLMAAFRSDPPRTLAGISVCQSRDFAHGLTTNLSNKQTASLQGPTGNLVMLDLEDEGNYVAIRPSGTEPKIKLYVFTRLAPEDSQNLAAAHNTLQNRIERLEADMRAYVSAQS